MVANSVKFITRFIVTRKEPFVTLFNVGLNLERTLFVTKQLNIPYMFVTIELTTTPVGPNPPMSRFMSMVRRLLTMNAKTVYRGQLETRLSNVGLRLLTTLFIYGLNVHVSKQTTALDRPRQLWTGAGTPMSTASIAAIVATTVTSGTAPIRNVPPTLPPILRVTTVLSPLSHATCNTTIITHSPERNSNPPSLKDRTQTPSPAITVDLTLLVSYHDDNACEHGEMARGINSSPGVINCPTRLGRCHLVDLTCSIR